MIIVSGTIHVRSGARNDFLRQSAEAVSAARQTPGCIDFAVSADTVDPDRVNVYEAWDSEPSLLAFRGEGPGADLSSFIVSASVRRHVVASSGPA